MEQLNFASVKDTDKVYRILGDLINANREFQIMITVPRDGKNVITDAAGLSAGDRIDLAMRDGNVLAVVEKTEKKTEG